MTQYNYKILNVLGDGSADPFSESSTQLYPLGAKLEYGDRTFRYAKLDSSNVDAGKLLQTRVAEANHRDRSVSSAVSAGASTITVNLGTPAAAENEYSEGYLHINAVAGNGQLFRIKSHPAHPADTTADVVFTLYDKVKTALTGSSKADLIHSSYHNLIVAPAAETGAVSGVTVIDMTASNYGWIQTSGPCSILHDASVASIVLGETVVRSNAVAGAVRPAPSDVLHSVGQTLVVNANTLHSVIHLKLE